ncbi:hypothetical protein L6386_03535 [bacterium]|nr:hypothetical protein [bacterium]MCG2676878.1 hypothetical protein [bacterium]MCG2677615.1 hypothetical protein [bacterium]
MGKWADEKGRNGEAVKVSRQAIKYQVSSIQHPGSRIKDPVSVICVNL